MDISIHKACLGILLAFLLGFTTGCITGKRMKAEPQTARYEYTLKDTLDNWSILQLAIIKTESDFNPLAVGRTKDVGIFQQTPIYVEEVNRISKQEYMHEDAFSPSRALEMFNIYQEHYNPGKDKLKAIKLHNPGGESINYTKRVLQNMEYIERYEAIRKLIIHYNGKGKDTYSRGGGN